MPLMWRPQLRRTFGRWWAVHGRDDKHARRAVWRAVAHDVGGLRRALRASAQLGPDGARAKGAARLAELLRHPGRISEQLVTLRAVQTLALVDLLNYREHVFRLGAYAELGDAPGPLLEVTTDAAPAGGAAVPMADDEFPGALPPTPGPTGLGERG